MKGIREIRAELETIFKDPTNTKVYLGFGDSQNRVYRVADFDDEATKEVSAQFSDGLKSFISDSALQTRPLSSLDSRTDTIYQYDLDDKPAEFQALTNLANGTEPPVYSFKELDFSGLRTIVIKISTTKKSVLFVKQFFPVSLVKRDQLMLVMKDDKRFTTINQDIIRITNGFEVMLLDGDFFVTDVNKLERAFGFDKVTARQKTIVVEAILRLDYIEDTGGHIASLDVSKRDLLRAKNSPVFSLSKEIVLAFVEGKAKTLGLKIVSGKIQLKSRASVARFVKLLNDDYLTSELTHIYYEAAAKDKLVAVAA